jgi:hypothetical protein
MHHRYFEFHRAQTGRRFTRQQTAANHYDGLLQVAHFAQSESVTHRAEINYVSEIYARDRRSDRSASHRQTSFLKLDALPVAEHGQAALNVELLDDRAQPHLDLVFVVPMRIDMRELFERRGFFTQEILR